MRCQALGKYYASQSKTEINENRATHFINTCKPKDEDVNHKN